MPCDPHPPFSRVLFFPGLKPGKNKTREKGGIHIGLLTQGGAPLALGYYYVVPTGLCFGSLRSHKGQMDKVQLSSRPQLSGRTRNRIVLLADRAPSITLGAARQMKSSDVLVEPVPNAAIPDLCRNLCRKLATSTKVATKVATKSSVRRAFGADSSCIWMAQQAGAARCAGTVRREDGSRRTACGWRVARAARWSM